MSLTEHVMHKPGLDLLLMDIAQEPDELRGLVEELSLLARAALAASDSMLPFEDAS